MLYSFACLVFIFILFYFILFILFYFLLSLLPPFLFSCAACGILVPQPGIPCPLQWKRRVPITGLPGKSMFIFYIPHISDNIQYLSFSVWLILLSIISSRFIHIVEMTIFHAFLWLSSIPVCVCLCVCVCVCVCVFVHTTSFLSIHLLMGT